MEETFVISFAILFHLCVSIFLHLNAYYVAFPPIFLLWENTHNTKFTILKYTVLWQ